LLEQKPKSYITQIIHELQEESENTGIFWLLSGTNF
ncbi:hypothetical protein C804_04216, partial [Lachnospiraceae bacterium A4]